MDLPKAIRDLYYPPICDFKDLAEKTTDPAKKVYDLSQAVPDYPPPEEIRLALKRFLNTDDYSHYTADEGTRELREAIAQELGRLYARPPAAESICLTAGANNAFFSVLNTLAEAGDEIVFLAPYYFNYYMAAVIRGLKPVEIVRDPAAGFPLPLAEIERALGPRTRAVVLVNPCNPTGRSSAQEEVDALFALCRERGVVLISDEVYNYFHDAYPRPASVLNIEGFEEHAVAVHSYSKTFSLTGLRVGFVAASTRFLREFMKVHDTNVICAPSIGQAAALGGLRASRAWLEGKIEMMRARLKAFQDAFASRPSRFRLRAAGAFFVYLESDMCASADEICRGFLRKENIIMLPGTFFGPGQERCVRLALGNVSAEEIPAVVDKMHAFGAGAERS
ncbi:MAG: aminotransferase class I/II-fold pyridoxal phosphate-dependent enzyme [Elusimicrobiota bacterium]